MKEPTRKFETEAEWLEARQQGIGGSDAAAAVGASKWKSPLELYVEKIGLADPETQKANSEIIRWGKRLEEPIREAYEEETGRTVFKHGLHLFVSEDQPFMMCTLDGSVLKKTDDKVGVFESKNTGYYREREILEEVPLEFQIQVQHEMAVGEWEWASIAILLNGRKLLWLDIPRNDEFIKAMTAAEKELWDRIQNRNPPPVSTPFESAGKALRALHPVDRGGVIELPLECLAMDRELQRCKDELEEWTAKKVMFETMIKEKIGDNTVGLLPGGNGAYSFKQQQRREFVSPATSFRVLRRMKK